MKMSEAVAKYGSQAAAARELGIPRSTLRNRLKGEKSGAAKRSPKTSLRIEVVEPDFVAPTLPSGKITTAALVRRLADDARLKKDLRDAEKWMKYQMRTNDPIGVVWFGDPHLGTSTAWDRLEADIATTVSTPGLFGANIGDTTNNWTGRLTRMYAEEDISRKSERRLAKWFMADAGITWLLWLMGNHDEWEHGSEILRLMDIHNRVTMAEWSAKIELVFPNKKTVRINAAHDFPGHSMWNNTHAPARAPRMLGTDADLFICGHRHDWGIQQYELAERGRCPMAIRARGYKVGDPYARAKGYQEAEHGSSILTIFDPTAGPAGKVLAFADVQQGARVLSALRGGK